MDILLESYRKSAMRQSDWILDGVVNGSFNDLILVISDVQFDCTLNNVIATITKIRSLKVVGI